jgi:hypothetical protein
MIEVLFCESECGAMKMAKNYRKPDFQISTPGWNGRKPSNEELDQMFEGKAVGGNASEVICLPFMLDIGDINISIESDYRKKILFDMYSRNEVIDNSTFDYFDDAWKRSLGDIKRLKDYADQGELIRIWYSDAPYSVCGFHYVCSILSAYDCKVFAVKLPQYVEQADNEMHLYKSWGEVRAGDFYKFTHLEKEFSSHEIKAFACIWDELKEENGQLRAIVNGKLIGVPDDYYDNLIRNEIQDGDFVMSHLIVKLLINYPLGIGDWWYAKRIQRMIENGELKIVQKDEEIYSQVLKKV